MKRQPSNRLDLNFSKKCRILGTGSFGNFWFVVGLNHP